MSHHHKVPPKLSQEQRESAEYFEHKSYYRHNGPLGGHLSFNAENGYLEALVRGFRSGFLTKIQYRQMQQCLSMGELRLVLMETDYGNYLSGVPVPSPDSSGKELAKYGKILMRVCVDKFLSSWDHIRLQAVGELQSFLDMISYSSMLKNFTTLITGVINHADPEKLLGNISNIDSGLGYYPSLKRLVAFDSDAVADRYDLLEEIYDVLLVETPISCYFERFFFDSLQIEEHEDAGREVSHTFKEVELDIIKDTLQRYWLEDFCVYCKKLGGETWSVMKELLDFEADRRSIEIVANSFGTPLGEQSARDTERKNLLPRLGKLYPTGHDLLSGTSAWEHKGGAGSMKDLRQVLDRFETFQGLVDDDEKMSISTRLREREVATLRRGFESQGHFGVFYAWVKLSLIELQNIQVIVEAVGKSASERKELLTLVTPLF